MLPCLSDGRVGTTIRSEAVAARMKGRLKDPLQNLEESLLHDSIDHVGHGRIELHLDPANFWGRLRLPTPFISSVGRS